MRQSVSEKAGTAGGAGMGEEQKGKRKKSFDFFL
jgi:hypothetical protein